MVDHLCDSTPRSEACFQATCGWASHSDPPSEFIVLNQRLNKINSNLKIQKNLMISHSQFLGSYAVGYKNLFKIPVNRINSMRAGLIVRRFLDSVP